MEHVAKLYEMIKPERYALHFRFKQTDTEFVAKETVKFVTSEATRELVWHGLELAVTKATVDGVPATASFDVDAQTVRFTLPAEIPAGQHSLELEFTGPVQDSLHGLYRSSFTHEGQQQWLVMTQFEAIHAREAFVCIDEPAAKAVFEVSLTVDDGLTVLGNMPVAHEEPAANGMRTVQFAESPKMSTYLLAWVVSALAEVSGKTAEGVTIRVYATPAYANQLAYALDYAQRSLSFYHTYFGVAYPLPKLDLVAVPNFAAGAMENWGLVTYRETDLLVDKANTSMGQLQRVAEVIAHELAHQWFGNLVTMAWWNDLWLNESFASWAETMTVDHLNPEWEWWASFTSGLGAYARDIDSLANTHAIQVEVKDPKALDEIFDAISYFKGQSIIRMLEGYVGAETFRKGLQTYIKRHAYSNAVTDDLWKALGEASGQDIATLMHSWTNAPGYPVLSYHEGRVSQERFIASPRETKRLKAAGSEATVWPVPFAAILPDGSVTEPVLLDAAETELPAAVAGAGWFKPNPGERSFFRSVYNTEAVAALRVPLQSGTLALADRYGVVSDVLAAVASGRAGSRAALELLEALQSEQNYIAALAVYEGLGDILNVVEDPATRTGLEAFGAWLAGPNYERLGWQVKPGETHFDTLLRPVVLQQALRFEIEGAGAEGLRRFAAYAGGAALDPNVRSAVLYAAARYGSEEHYEQLLHLYQNELAPHTRQAQMTNLGRFRQPELAQRTLDWSLSKDVKSQDVVYAMGGVCRTRESRELAWKFIQASWPELVKRFGEGGHMLDRFPAMAGGTYASHAKAKELAEFFAAHPHPATTRPVAQTIEAIELRADWADRDADEIAAFVNEWTSTRKG